MISTWIDKITNTLLGPFFYGHFEFMNKAWLLLIFLAILLFIWRRVRRGSSMRYSNIELLRSKRRSPRVGLYFALSWLEFIGLVFLIFALARPRSASTSEQTITEGIDIIVTLDISTSMRAEDFKPKNRLEAAKIEAEKFITARSTDRIGLVIFAAKAFTVCPLTLDYNILIDFLRGVEMGQIEDGTAIGTAIATATNRLRESTAKSKVIILLTDGINNRGQIDPITAAKAASALGIKIYTIGAGKPGYALYPIDDPFFGRRHIRVPVEIDEPMLTTIANLTKGKYFRATDTESLRKILKEIDELEKTKIEVKQWTRYRELFPIFLVLGLVFLLLDIFIRNTLLRKIP